ncbi:hypothetical protein ACLOJK_029889 [Asimina triloba]
MHRNLAGRQRHVLSLFYLLAKQGMNAAVGGGFLLRLGWHDQDHGFPLRGMFHPKKPPPPMNSHDNRHMCVQADSGLVLTTDPKPRLRWTVELHERFVDAVTQLGGPDKATPKTIMRVMGVKGLTLYHLKSHLQVQKHLQLWIEAQSKYMQTILEKACQTLSGQNMAQGRYKCVGSQDTMDMGILKDMGSPLNFLSLQDLNIYGGGEEFEMQQQIEGNFPSNDHAITLGKKIRPSPYGYSSKSPLNWADDLRLQELGIAAGACLGSGEDAFKGDMDPMTDVYGTRPSVPDHGIEDKKFELSVKLERPSPQRGPLHVGRLGPMIKGNALTPARNVSCG